MTLYLKTRFLILHVGCLEPVCCRSELVTVMCACGALPGTPWRSVSPLSPSPLSSMRCKMQLISFKRPTWHSTAQNEQGPVGVLGYISESPRPGAHFCGAHIVVNGEGQVTSVFKKVPELRGIWIQVWEYYQVGENSKHWNMINVSVWGHQRRN